MKFVEPKVEYWQQPSGKEGMWDQIARVTRLCYDSKPREGETSKEFVNRVILKPSWNKITQAYDFDKQHGGMLEFGTVYLKLPYTEIDESINNICKPFIYNSPISPYFEREIYKPNRIIIGSYYYVTSNLRFILEHNLWDKVKEYIVEPDSHFMKRHCFHVITNIGVSREWNRHRSSMSIAEQSTRYVDFTKKNHGSNIPYARPTWISKEICQQIEESLNSDEDLYDIKDKDYYPWLASLVGCETMYFDLRKKGWRPEQARVVLPLETKTEVAYCAFTDSWKHFCLLRSSMAVSGKPHPDIVPLADNITEYLHFK